jgi:hypothetical protein
MTERDLFAEMDAIADALRESDPTLRESLCDELQLEFRQHQKRRMPTLSKGEFCDLFGIWLDQYRAKLEAELAELRKRIAANDCEMRRLIAERHKPGNSTDARDHFVCRCGAIIDDPADPKMLELHGPHFQAASLDRVQEGLERWRAFYGL